MIQINPPKKKKEPGIEENECNEIYEKGSKHATCINKDNGMIKANLRSNNEQLKT